MSLCVFSSYSSLSVYTESDEYFMAAIGAVYTSPGSWRKVERLQCLSFRAGQTPFLFVGENTLAVTFTQTAALTLCWHMKPEGTDEDFQSDSQSHFFFRISKVFFSGLAGCAVCVCVCIKVCDSKAKPVLTHVVHMQNLLWICLVVFRVFCVCVTVLLL